MPSRGAVNRDCASLERLALLDTVKETMQTHYGRLLTAAELGHLEESVLDDRHVVAGPAKWNGGLDLIQSQPQLWFRDQAIDDRDRALLDAPRLPWVNLGKHSFLSHMYHKVKGQAHINTTTWTVENDIALRRNMFQAGAGFIGFDGLRLLAAQPRPDWQHMMVNVNIDGNIAPNVTWGLMCGRPSKARLLAGPSTTCGIHPWDAMILRDVHANSLSMEDIESIGSRKFDILLMKLCEDFINPWVVIAVKDVGPLPSWSDCSNGCDSSNDQGECVNCLGL